MELTTTAPKETPKGTIIIVYPVVVFAVAVAINFFFLEITPLHSALPAKPILAILVVSASLLVVNHIWLMTRTELTRLKFDLHATPEEWQSAGKSEQEASQEAIRELARHHNAHRNATENTVYFALLAVLFSLTSPSVLAATIWLTGFAVGRLGHSFGFIKGRDGIRGLFMTISLLALFGLLSHLILATFA